MYRGIVLAAALMLVILVAGACAPRNATPAPAAASGGSPTAGQLAEAGQGVYAKSCQGCHGTASEAGRAPALIGANAKLGAKYSDGQGLYDYISKSMPRGTPGSLSAQEYLQVLSYLLVENKFVDAGIVVDALGLATISLGD